MKYLSPIISQGRRSIGAQTWSRNRAGNYIKSKPIPIQPRTTPQQANRAVFGAASALWKTLTQTQRDGWNTLAASINFSDMLGTSYRPSGAQLATQIFANQLNTIGTTTLDPPSGVPSVTQPSGSTSVFTTTTPAHSYVITQLPTPETAEWVILRMTPPIPASQTYISQSRYRNVMAVLGVDGIPDGTDLYTAYVAFFGTAGTVGQKIGWQIQNYSSTGWPSAVETDYAIIAAS